MEKHKNQNKDRSLKDEQPSINNPSHQDKDDTKKINEDNSEAENLAETRSGSKNNKEETLGIP